MNKDKPNSKTLEDQKKIIKEIRTKNDKIKEILRKCCAEEVEEFLATSMAVSIHIL
jgi:spore cortex formation protein SpoVR/YcgB (stage V sporulation)